MSDSAYKDHFSDVADAYARYRPRYPAALFDFLADLPPGRELAWDCGCGNGQAAEGLARHFRKVIATDASARQIEQAVSHPAVTYRVAPAEASGIASGSVDLVLVAQALHWFDFDRFYAEVRRVARPGGILAALTYGLLQVDGKIDPVLARFYTETVGTFWPPERKWVDAGYATIPFPFEAIATPSLAMEAEWTFPQLLGYLGTWSAVKEYRRRNGTDPLELVRDALQDAWGEPESAKKIAWPISMRIGRVGKEP